MRSRRLLEQAEFDERIKLTEAQMDTLDQLSVVQPGKRVMRNAAAIVRALELKLSYGYSKPKQSLEVTGKLTLEQVMVEAHRRRNAQ